MASSAEKSPPLTPINLMRLIQTKKSWWDERRVGRAGVPLIPRLGLLSVLGIPHSKEEELREQCSSEDKAVLKCIEWWLQHFTISWREIIYKLDKGGEVKLADGLRMYAEPLKDHSLNAENLTEVLKEVKTWMIVAQFGLSVPCVIMDRISKEYSSVDEKKAALAHYIVVTLPSVTWETIAAKLYYSEETRAVEQAKLYIHRIADPTLTAANIMEMLKTLSFMRFAHVLDVPFDKFPNDGQGKETVVSHVLRTHPCLTWKRLSNNLRMCGYNDEAERVVKKYVKGGVSLFLLCVNHIVHNYEFYQPVLPQYLPHHIQTHIHQEWEETRRSMIY